MKFLIYGKTSWISAMMQELLKGHPEHEVHLASARLEDFPALMREIADVKPETVMNFAGLTGYPTVDSCESDKENTYFVNTIGVYNLAMACHRNNVYLANYSTGCIYQYDEKHPIGTSFTEDDPPNFRGSTYSNSKLIAEQLLACFDNVLTLRVRMPISADGSRKCLLTKLANYAKIVDIPNSITILPEMLPISLTLIEKHVTGIINLTNPGAISHNMMMELYKKYLKPDHTWVNFTVEEQDAILKSKRSNCELSSAKLLSYIGHVDNVYVALEKLLAKKAA